MVPRAGNAGVLARKKAEIEKIVVKTARNAGVLARKSIRQAATADNEVTHTTIMNRLWSVALGCFAWTAVAAQTFTLEQHNDSLYVLLLKTNGMVNKWQLPYPVYQFQTGDVDGDGITDAMVGVVKSTRFYPEKGKRLFIFKNYHGKIRTLWMGSKLGGILEDFRFIDGKIRSLESTTDGRYVVAEYQWAHFGMDFVRFIATNVTLDEARNLFYNP